MTNDELTEQRVKQFLPEFIKQLRKAQRDAEAIYKAAANGDKDANSILNDVRLTGLFDLESFFEGWGCP